MPPSRSHRPADLGEPPAELTIGELLRRAAREVPDRECLIEVAPGEIPRRRWTYAEASAEAETVARILAARFAPGERIALWAPNQAEWFFLQFGAALAGLTLVPVNPAFVAREAEHVLEHSGSVGLFLAREYRGASKAAAWEEIGPRLPAIRDVVFLDQWESFLRRARREGPLPAVSPSDPVMIQYTSGTTGLPKGVHQSHQNVVNTRFANDRLELAEGTVWLNFMPMFHIGGCIYMTLGALWNRGTQVMMHAFDAELALGVIESERVGFLIGVPTMLGAMLDHPDFGRRRLDSLRTIASGGSPVSPELVRRIESSFAAEYLMIFGQTETCYPITHSRRSDPAWTKSETVGSPVAGTEVRIADPESGETVLSGAVGEICVRGVGNMIGYYRDPEATAAAVDAEGWLHTGDLGTMDADGYLRVTGRLKDMIIRGGENVFPREIEDVLATHPEVADAAVFGVPDPQWGEQPVAAVRLRPGALPDAAALETFLRARLARHKIPRDWQFVDGFPLTASGKVQKFVLRERYSQGKKAE